MRGEVHVNRDPQGEGMVSDRPMEAVAATRPRVRQVALQADRQVALRVAAQDALGNRKIEVVGGGRGSAAE